MEIRLTKNKVTIVDKDDHVKLGHRKWYFGPGGYACRFQNRRVIFLHREIMEPPKGLVVDHVNHNKLDNRRCNLRIVSKSANSFNRKGANSNNKTTNLRNIHLAKSGYYRIEVARNGTKKRTNVKTLEKAIALAEKFREELGYV